MRIVLLVTSPRVAPGALTWQAWEALRSGPVFTREQEHPQRAAMAAADIVTEAVDPEHSASAIARILRDAATRTGTATWLAGPAGDDDIGLALGELSTRAGELGDDVEIEVVLGSWDQPGGRLLDVVATMDRLRSPDGCPWDAQQTHDSLAPYLLEEAYEAFQAIEDEDSSALREELGDVLLQVVFHARLAEEADDADGAWSIDDVAAGLVAKLVRRHPHVFGATSVSGADEVVHNWDVIKRAEKGDRGALEGVPLAQAALTLAATLQRKATKLGVPAGLIAPELEASATPAAAVSALAAAFENEPQVDTAGALLWTTVALLRQADVDAESVLRARSREFRDRVGAVEQAAQAAGADVHAFDEGSWHRHWDEQG
ncbi:MAG TPA: MazG family protein [Mycobacteriales bacterium]|nr:MazG family protein [Mycobacteriales bacterium]